MTLPKATCNKQTHEEKSVIPVQSNRAPAQVEGHPTASATLHWNKPLACVNGSCYNEAYPQVCTRVMSTSLLIHNRRIMAVRLIFLSLATLISSCQAGFKYTYNEITTQVVNACLADTSYSFDRQSIALPNNCRDTFDCVLSKVPDRMQMNLSSGSAILDFVS